MQLTQLLAIYNGFHAGQMYVCLAVCCSTNRKVSKPEFSLEWSSKYAKLLQTSQTFLRAFLPGPRIVLLNSSFALHIRLSRKLIAV